VSTNFPRNVGVRRDILNDSYVEKEHVGIANNAENEEPP
jgi:hypothetical protein